MMMSPRLTPPNEKNNLDDLERKGLCLLNCAPKIWNADIIPEPQKVSLTTCREAVQKLYGSGFSDAEYAKKLTRDYVCWVYEETDDKISTYMYCRTESRDKHKRGGVNYKPIVKKWLAVFHPHPASYYKTKKCDKENPYFDLR